MHHGKLKLIVAVSLLCSSLSALAGSFYSGNDLYRGLEDYRRKNTQDIVHASSMTGYLTAVADVMDGRIDGATGYKFCIPVGVTRGQLIDVVLHYLERTPESRHLSAWSLVEDAYAQTFPCRK
jgi:hypothetical protein